MDDAVEIIELQGFDPEGEPEVRVMADGTLYLMFNFMPPSWAEADAEAFDDFEQQLTTAIGIPVEQEDREWFRIDLPQPDTIALIQQFLCEQVLLNSVPEPN
jgi:hypothetical protein